MALELLDAYDGVELWRITHSINKDAEAFIVKDSSRTPKDWACSTLAEAQAKYDERLKNAETQAPILRR